VDGFIDIDTKYLWQTVHVKVNRRIDGSLSFTVENRYKAIMPVTKDIYGHNKDCIFDAVKHWSDGDMIHCEVIDIKKSHSNLFVIKWLPEKDFSKNIGKTVQVQISINTEGKLSFIADDKYKVVMPVTKAIYGKNCKLVVEALKSRKDGEMIDCEVLDADFYANQFVAKWLPNDKTKLQIGDRVSVKILKNDLGMEFVADDQFKAVMPVTKVIYGKNFNQAEKAMSYWSDGDIIDGTVLQIEPYTDVLTVKWLPDKLLQNYIGKTIPVRVCKNEDGNLVFMIDMYNAVIPVTKTIYGNKTEIVEEAIKNLSDGDVIDCQILNVDPYQQQFIVKWLPKSKYEAYIGKAVTVRVSKNKEGNNEFVVENQFKAEIPVKKSFYGTKTSKIKEALQSLSDGDLIECHVWDVEPYTDLFVIVWLMKNKVEHLPKPEMPEINIKVVGKIDLGDVNTKTRPDKKSRRALEKMRKESMKHAK
jgi:hypothetical protein